MAIKECHEEKGYPIEAACELLHVARSAYHKWACGKLSRRAEENERLADTIEKIHEKSPDKGYRRLNDDLRHDYGIHVNDKRVLRICRARDIKSTIKYSNQGCTRQATGWSLTMERAATETADLPRMTEKQFSRAKKLLRRLCANYDRGNCLLLDDGYDPCPQLLSNTLLCRYFRAAVLSADWELCEEILGACLKYCAGCGSPFVAAARNTIYCPTCAADRVRRNKRRWAAENKVRRRKSRG